MARSALLKPMFNVSTPEELAEVLVGTTDAEISRTASRLRFLYSPRKRKARQLFVPRDELKTLQGKIKIHILSKVQLLPCVYGGVPGMSMKNMVKQHSGQDVVFATDIEKCFPSIKPRHVYAVFLALGFAEPIAGLLTKLTTWHGELPQGTKTSPALANLVLSTVDLRLSQLCAIHGFTYTRWVDDIYISGSYRVLKFKSLIVKIINDEGFSLKSEKTKFMEASGRQTVLHAVANRFPNLPRENISQIKKQLAEEAAIGYLTNSAKGKLYWLRHFNPEVGDALLSKYAALM